MIELLATLGLDALVAVLLGITIFYCGKLNRRIRILQDGKSELAQLIQKFDESTQLATRSIHEIHSASKKINESIQAKLDKANYIADDLHFMIDRGNKLADQMEGQISATRGQKPAAAAARPEPGPSRRPAASEESPSISPREAARLEEVRRARPQPAERAAPEGADRNKRASALESVMEKISATKQGNKPEAAAPEPRAEEGKRRIPNARLRSQAEQELLDALKTERS